MEKRYSKVLGMQVISQSDHCVLGRVIHVLLDNDKGTVVAFMLSLIGDRIILPVDVVEINSAIIVQHPGDVMHIDDVQRVVSIKQSGEYILTKKVVSESGFYLGRVYDYSFDTDDFRLRKIFVNKVLLWILFPQKSLIDAKHILEIAHDRIVVKDAVIGELKMGTSSHLTTDFN